MSDAFLGFICRVEVGLLGLSLKGRGALIIPRWTLLPYMSGPSGQAAFNIKAVPSQAPKPRTMINLIEVLDPDFYSEEQDVGTPMQRLSAISLLNLPPRNDITISSPRKSVQGTLGYLSGRTFDFEASSGSPSASSSIKYSEIDGSIEVISLEMLIIRVTLNPGP